MSIICNRIGQVNPAARVRRFGAGILPHDRDDEAEYAQFCADRERAAREFNDHARERVGHLAAMGRREREARAFDAMLGEMADRFEASRRVEEGSVC